MRWRTTRREWLEDLLGAVCLFAIGYGVFLFGYGMGW
jgi:hypothetical protein